MRGLNMLVLPKCELTMEFTSLPVGSGFKTHDGQAWVKITSTEAMCANHQQPVLFAGPNLPPVLVAPQLGD